jgi:hypothetical protein
LLAEGEVRYEVRIEVKAAYDPLVIAGEPDRDYRAEIAGLLRQLERLSDQEIANRVYRTFEFDLCSVCQRSYLENPLGLHS